MHSARGIALVVLLGVAGGGSAQQPAPTPAPPGPPAPAASVIAVTVNGQNIPELAIYRALQRIPPAQRDAARKDVLNFLIDTALIDQYLDQLKVAIDGKEVDAAMQQMKDECAKLKKSWEDVLKITFVTEPELRVQITNQLRWEKFVAQYATDKALKDYFEQNRAMFDGSQVRARHVLLSPPADNAQAVEQAKAKLLALKKQIQEKVAQELAKAPATDKLAQEKARMKLLDDTFAEVATKESACGTSKNGGDLGWFTRAGPNGVEPFARAAFALKPYEMTDVVQTDFGYHLILVVDQKAGREVKFEEVREMAKEVYAERLREAVISRARPAARVVVNPQPK